MKEFTVLYRVVEESGLACVMKSGSLPVLATPQMIAWMEEAACADLKLEAGKTSVGIAMDCSHDAPSPKGARIRIEAQVTERAGKIITFEISAWMNETRIGKAVHKRAVVDEKKFLSRIYPAWMQK